MISALFFKDYSFEWWHIFIVSAFVLFSFYDNSKGFEQEIDYAARKNKILMDIYKSVRGKKFQDIDSGTNAC